MGLPLHELAALGTAACWATTGIFAADAVRAMGPFHFNLIRQWMVIAALLLIVAVSGAWVGVSSAHAAILGMSGLVGILIGDTFNFAAVGRIGPRRAGAIFALNAPIAAVMGWLVLGEALPPIAILGIILTVAGVAMAIMGRTPSGAHRFETLEGRLIIGAGLGLCAAFAQATGSLIARPAMATGLNPYVASLCRVGASGVMMGLMAATPLAPKMKSALTGKLLALTAGTAVLGLLIGMTLLLYALEGAKTGIIATLSATSPVIILPLIWLRTGQRPSGLSWAGAALAVAGLTLIFAR